MSLSNRDKNLLIIVLGVLVLILVYFFPVKSLNEKTKKEENEIGILSAKVNELQALAAQEKKLIEQTEELNKDTEDFLSRFPSLTLVEDEILFLKELEEENGLSVTSITVADPKLVGDEKSTAEKVNEETSAGAENQNTGNSSETPSGTGENSGGTGTSTGKSVLSEFNLYVMPTTITFTADYRAFKKMLDGITKFKEAKSIHEASVSFDPSTGTLTGSIVYYAFYIDNLEKAYEKPEIEGIRRGTKNIFGTIDVSGLRKKIRDLKRKGRNRR